jgi:iron(II)-dependent oxidoreductase
VRQMVAEFHRRGVRVLFPMMMWDQGTHDPGKPWTAAIAEVMKEIGADGINGDTQDGVPLAYSLAADAVQHPLAFEPEGSPSDEALAWNVMTWGQYKFPFVPEVDKFKWLEPRHMVNISDRWARDKTNDLQFAFFNGVGWESWENVWGIWNGITPRDAEATRRVSAMERAVAPFLTSAQWEPHFPMQRYGVFSSRWPLQGETVWTIVNRNEYDVDGKQMIVPDAKGMRYFDLYHGAELVPVQEGGKTVLSFPMEAHGYGAILATMQPPSERVEALMREMKTLSATPLSGYSHEWKTLPQTLVEIAATKAAAEAPAGMVKIPAGRFRFEVEGTEIEGFDDVGVDVQYPWEDSPRRFHSHAMEMKSYFIDKFPVTNAEFARFMKSAQYRPKDALNFLRDWKNGSFPAGWENKPVTWVSVEDARAYATWAGKRLPHEWEWQYAAQGTDGRRYPWGERWNAQAVPGVDKRRKLTSPDDVDAHPAGASGFGVMDMVGNVWQWTDEYVDEHTRGEIVRGGSYYEPEGAVWYFPQAYANGQHSKLLLMSPSMDRSGTVGFRCVVDAK